MYLPVKPPRSVILMDLALRSVSLETSAVRPAVALPVVIVVSDPIGAHFTAVVAGRSRALIVTLAVPVGNAPGGGEADGDDEHAVAPAATRAAAIALTNGFCTIPSGFSPGLPYLLLEKGSRRKARR
jgi:hypothetical protein